MLTLNSICDTNYYKFTNNRKKQQSNAMNVSKYNHQRSLLSSLSRSCLLVFKVSGLVCATVFATLLLLCGGNAKAYSTANVLTNPGAETGDLTGWSVSLTGYSFVVSTNGLVANTTNENFVAHSGEYTFELFDTTGNSSYIYQNFAADPGSQWMASCYALCYASNYLQSGEDAFMQMVFYDASNNVVPYPGAAGGTYASDFLDPNDYSGLGINYTVVPPLAVDGSGWLFLQATNVFDTDPATEASYDPSVSPVSPILTAPPGTAYVQYRLEFDSTVELGGDAYFDDCVLQEVQVSDPDISTAPTAVTTYAGSPASFTVVATHTSAYPGEKLTYQWQYNGTNLPAAGGVNNISGSTTTAVLNFNNLVGADAGLYDVVVTLKSTAGNYTNTIRSVPVPLTVLTLSPLQKANKLGANFGFETDPVWQPWSVFNGCYFATTASFYGATTTPVNVFDGNDVALIGGNGDRDNGFYMQIAAAPGSLWKAGGWAYISSLNDFVDGNTCRLQIWFLNSVGGSTTPGTPTYESFKMYGLGYTNSDAEYTSIDASSSQNGQLLYHDQLPRDQWCFLPVTNVVDDSGIGLENDIPYTTLTNGYFMVPTNSAGINFQMYEYCPQATDTPTPQADLGGSASDAVYWDDMELIQITPVTNLTASVSSGNINLSFSGGAGLDYAILYKTNLTDTTWSVLTNNVTVPDSWATNTASVGTTYPITVSDHLTTHNRFYRVQSE